VVVTKAFLPLVTAQAKARGITPRLLAVEHPVGGLNRDELQRRISVGAEAFVKELERLRTEGYE